MNEFIKKYLVWICIGLCVTGVVLSIVGIPTKQPICFFIGVVLSLPTIGYIIYQVFFDKGKAELTVAPAIKPIGTGNLTTVIENKEDVMLTKETITEEDLEPLYNGYASDEEIAMHLQDLIPDEITPLNDLPTTNSVADATTDVTDTVIENTAAIIDTTNGELYRQREINGTATPTLDILPIPPLETAVAVVPADSVPTKPRRAKEPIDPEARRLKAEEKKALLSNENLARYLQRYYIETAACFLLDRNIYKDNYGIAPYNRFAINKDTDLPEYSMATSKTRLYKFCSYLIDAERFITHPTMYGDFIIAIEKGISLARISETLHPIYRRKYKKDFILNLSNREDWDNVMILVYNNYILDNDNFKDVFIRVPFEIPEEFTEQNIVAYLSKPEIRDRFAEKFPALTEIGIGNIWDAMYICFVNTIKQKLSIEQLESAILRDYKKIARLLKRTDNHRPSLMQAS